FGRGLLRSEQGRHVDAACACGDDPGAHPVEVRLVELRKIEFRLAVVGEAGSGAGPGEGREEALLVVGVVVPAVRLFPGPEAEEVVGVSDEKVEIGVEIEWGWRIGEAAIPEVSPGMRSGEKDGLAGAVREIARVQRIDAERAGSGRAGVRCPSVGGASVRASSCVLPSVRGANGGAAGRAGRAG